MCRISSVSTCCSASGAVPCCAVWGQRGHLVRKRVGNPPDEACFDWQRRGELASPRRVATSPSESARLPRPPSSATLSSAKSLSVKCQTSALQTRQRGSSANFNSKKKRRLFLLDYCCIMGFVERGMWVAHTAKPLITGAACGTGDLSLKRKIGPFWVYISHFYRKISMPYKRNET